MRALPDGVARLAALGWRLFPNSARHRAALVSERRSGVAAWALATHNRATLDAWAARFPGCNWCVATGGSGIWALDVDRGGETHEADGIAAMAALTRRYGPLPHGPVLQSGGGGYGVFFRDDGHEISGRTGTPSPGIDPRRGRLSITVPPSVHVRTRRPYRWIVAPWDVPPPPAPAWLLRLVKPPPEPPPSQPVRVECADARARLALDRASSRVSNAGDGRRNDTLWRAAHAVGGWIGAGALDEAMARAELEHAGRAAGMDRAEVLGAIKSGFKSGKKRPIRIDE